jgi:hypothetical protein
MRMSHERIMVTPPPTANPLTATTTGFDFRMSSSHRSCDRSFIGSLPSPCAGQDDDPDAVVPIEDVEGIVQLGDQLHGDGIEPLGAIEGKDRNAAAPLGDNLLIVRVSSPLRRYCALTIADD